MWNPQPDVDAWVPGASDDLYDERITEKMQHVDDLKKLIPFWLQQVEAAVSDGVELRYEDFLESLACTEERNDCPEWDVPMPDWAMDVNEDERSSVTGRAEQSTGNASERSDEDMRSVSNHSSDVVDRDAFVFVEKIAQMNALDEQRKRKLHAFYKVRIAAVVVIRYTNGDTQSPTAEKVAAIQGLIHVLKTTA